MNDGRRQLLHETYKMVDVTIMLASFMLVLWATIGTDGFHIHDTATSGSGQRALEAGMEAPGRDAGRSASIGEGRPTSNPESVEHDSALAPGTPRDLQAVDGTDIPGTEVGEEATPAGPVSSAESPAGSPAVRVGRAPRPGQPSTGVVAEVSPVSSWLLERMPDAWVERMAWVRKTLPWDRLIFFFAAIFAWHATFAWRGLYNSRRLDSRLGEAISVIRAGVIGSLVVIVLTFSMVKELFPQLEDRLGSFGLTFAMVAIGTTIVARLLIRYILEQVRKRGRNLRGILIVGTNPRAERFAKAIEAKRSLGYYVVGFVDEEWDGIAGFKKGGGRLVSNLANLGSFLSSNVVDEVIVALPVSSAYVHSSRIVSLCQEQGITVRFVSQIFDSRLAKGRLDVFEGEPMLSLEGAPDQGFAKLIKALLDRLAAAFLLLLISPILVMTALAIKISSPGPALFVQRRVGLNKRGFDVYKFRTMVPDAEARLKEVEHLNQVSGPVFKLEKDPRLIPIGDFLRKTSIDELPQLLNVLKGDMSLVGPRPLPERDYKGFDTDAHRRRLSVRPGITCTWQVGGRNSIPFEEWMQMDLEYIDNWSIWLDLKILFQTIPVVVGPLLFGKKGEFVRGIDDEEDSDIPPPTHGPAVHPEAVSPEAIASGSARMP